MCVDLGWEEMLGFGLGWGFRRVTGVGIAGLRSVGGAIRVVVDQTVEEVVVGFSSSVEDGGGRSPYNPPNIFVLIWKKRGFFMRFELELSRKVVSFFFLWD